MQTRSSGFTLLEFLLALAILGMIGVALAQTTTLGARAWRQSETLPERDAQVILRSELRQWIEAAKPHSNLGGLRQDASGTAHRFEFLTTRTLPVAAVGDEVRIVLTVQREQPDSAALLLRIDALDGSGDVVHSEQRLLIERASHISIRYFSVDRRTGERAWTDEWVSRNALPELIEIMADPPDAMHWPPFVVKTKLQ